MSVVSKTTALADENTQMISEFKHALEHDPVLASELLDLTQQLGQYLFTQDKSKLREHSEEIAKHPALRQIYIDAVLASRSKHGDLDHDRMITTAASNAISVLNYGSRSGIFPFHFVDVRDWSGIRVPYANLNYAVMAHCNLNDADLSNSSMICITLAHSQLQRANLSGVKSGVKALVMHRYDFTDVRIVDVTPHGHLLVRPKTSDPVEDTEVLNQEGDRNLGWIRGLGGLTDVVTFSRDGRFFVSSSRFDQALRIWDMFTYECKTVLQLDAASEVSPTTSAAFSPDSRSLVTAWSDGTVRIWDLETSHITSTFQHSGVYSVAWSPKGDKIVSSALRGNIFVWDLGSQDPAASSQEIIVEVDNDDPDHTLRFSGDGRYILCTDYEVHVWDATTGTKKATLKGHRDRVRCLVADPDGQHVYSASSDGCIRCWNLETEQCVVMLKHQYCDRVPDAFRLVLAPDGQTLMSYSSEMINTVVWDVEALKLCTPSPPDFRGEFAVVSADNRQLAVVNHDDNAISIYNTESGICDTTIPQCEDEYGDIHSQRYSPNGKLLAYMFLDKTINVWDLEKSEYIARFKSDEPLKRGCLHFSPNNDLLASVTDGKDSKVKLWNVMTQECMTLCEVNNTIVVCLEFSPDGCMLAIAAGGQEIQIWNIAMRKLGLTINNNNMLSLPQLSYSSCGRFIANRWDLGKVQVWSTRTGACVNTVSAQCFGNLYFHPSGQIITTGNSRKMISVSSPLSRQSSYTLRTRKLPVGYEGEISCLSFDGTVIASTSGHTTVDLWHLPELPWKSEVVTRGYDLTLPTVIAPTLEADQVVLNADRFIIIISASSEDGSVSVQHGCNKALTTFKGHPKAVACMELSPNKAYLATGSYDNTLRIWNLRQQESVQVFEGHTNAVTCVGFNSDGNLIASGSHDMTVRVWNIDEAKCVAQFEGHVSAIKQVVFSSDNTHLASVGSADPVIRIWNVATGECLLVLDQHTDEIFDIQFSTDGAHLMSGSRDNSVCVWETKTGKCIVTLKVHTDCLTCFVVTSDGKKVVTGSDDATICIWNVATGKCTATLKGHTGGIRKLCLTPDDRCLISASDDHVIHIWDLSTGELLHQLYGHTKPVTSIKLIHYDTEGESVLVSTSSDQTIRTWTVNRLPSSINWTPELRNIVGIPKCMNVVDADFREAQIDSHFLELVKAYGGKLRMNATEVLRSLCQ